MFGRSLEETMAVEARLGGEYIPILVHRCAKFILEHGKYSIFKGIKITIVLISHCMLLFI